MSKIKVKLLNKNCMPERTHRWDAGWDLKATIAITIPKGETKKVHTGVIIEIPPRHCGMVVPRSSLGTKHGINLANTVGIIDTEYRGEIIVFLTNHGNKDYEIRMGDRFCQLVIVAINSSELMEVDRVSETERGTGGFGSTTEKTEDITFDDKLMAVSEAIKNKGLTPVQKARLKIKSGK